MNRQLIFRRHLVYLNACNQEMMVQSANEKRKQKYLIIMQHLIVASNEDDSIHAHWIQQQKNVLIKQVFNSDCFSLLPKCMNYIIGYIYCRSQFVCFKMAH